jgi:hypothetical protein
MRALLLLVMTLLINPAAAGRTSVAVGRVDSRRLDREPRVTVPELAAFGADHDRQN